MQSATECTLRLAKASDLPTVDALNHLAYGRRLHRKLLDFAQLIVADYGIATAGFALVQYDLSDASVGLLGVVVHPEFRRLKVATQLVEAVQVKTVLLGKHAVAVVRRSNEPGVMLLESVGFVVDETIGDHASYLFARRLSNHARR